MHGMTQPNRFRDAGNGISRQFIGSCLLQKFFFIMERRTSGHPFEKIGKMELGGKTHDRGNLADVLIRIPNMPRRFA